MIRSGLQRHGFLLLLIMVYVVLAGLNSATIPLSKAPDEYVHFLYSRFIVEHGRLPVRGEERQEAGYKSDQPPLYYGLVALITGWVEVDRPPTLKMTWDSPRRRLADIILPRGMIVWTEDETMPYRGIVLAWFLGRWLSIGLSALTVGLVYLITLQIFPNRRHLALGAAAIVAFTPTYLFIASVLNDDNLTGLILALFFLVLVIIARGNKSPWLFVGLGVLMGLAVTTKYSTVVLPLAAAVALLLIARRWGWSRSEWLRQLVVCGLTAAVVASWWFIFVGWHFNEIDELGWGLGLLKPIVTGDASDPTVSRLTSLVVDDGSAQAEIVRGPFYEWLTTFFIDFWEVPVFGKAPLYPPLYTGLGMLLLCGLSVLGLWRIWRAGNRLDRYWLQLLSLQVMVFLILPLVRYVVSGQIHDTAQARHLLFPAAPAFGILLAWGFSTWFPERYRWRYYPLAGVLLGLSLAQLYYFSIAFPPRLPVRTVPELVQQPEHIINRELPNGLKLIGFDQRLMKTPAALELVLYWQALAPTDEDYRIELSLLDDETQVVAQTVAHPVHGRYPTRAWDPGDTVRDRMVLPLGGVKPGRYDLRLRLLGWDAPLRFEDGDDGLALAQLDLTGAEQAAPTSPLAGEVVQGFDLWQGGVIAGPMPTYRYLADIPITLYTRPTGAEPRLRLIGPDGQPREPASQAGSSSTFIVEYDWPSGPYRLAVEMWQNGSPAERVETGPVLTVDNRDLPFEAPPMSHRLEANFDNKIMLLGYDLPQRRLETGQGVPVLLYWQALARMRRSYVMFIRLLDANQQVWGGYDRLPQEIYNTFLWVPGEVVTDGFVVPVKPDIPDGIYQLVVGFYPEHDEHSSLPLVYEGQQTDTTRVTMGPIKIGGPPPGATLTEFQPQVDRNDLLGQEPIISLQGYDWQLEAGQLRLTFYWRSEARTDIDYTRFVHIRNAQGDIAAQSDGPPGKGLYPTSLWEPGEVIADEVIVSLPQNLDAASYQLAVGLYDPRSQQRLPVPASTVGDDTLYLTTLALR